MSNQAQNMSEEEGELRIFPKASELSEIGNNMVCPEEGCEEVFQNPPNLNWHLVKTHGKKKNSESGYGNKLAQFHCPEIGCKYYFNRNMENTKFSNRHFTMFKYLKQHYIKVHMEKPFKCSRCNKAFPTEIHRIRHSEVCGHFYTCSCGLRYSLMSSLQMHAMRKNHTFSKTPVNQDTSSFSKKMAKDKKQCELVKKVSLNKHQAILPPGTSILLLHGIVALDQVAGHNSLQILSFGSPSVNVSTQTEPAVPNRRRRIRSPVKSIDKSTKKRMSQQTQTGEKFPKKSSETQTTAQFLLNEGERMNKEEKKREKGMETLASNKIEIDEYPSRLNISRAMDEENTLLDDSFKKRDICLPQLWLNAETSKEMDSKAIRNSDFITDEMTLKSDNSSDTILETKNSDRTLSLYSDSDKNFTSLCHIETQTDNGRNSFLDEYLTNGETQTNDILDQDTRWTQTCDDTMLNDLVDFTNNETQTAWSFFYCSPLSSCINLVHSETQTPPHVQEFSIT